MTSTANGHPVKPPIPTERPEPTVLSRRVFVEETTTDGLREVFEPSEELMNEIGWYRAPKPILYGATPELVRICDEIAAERFSPMRHAIDRLVYAVAQDRIESVRHHAQAALDILNEASARPAQGASEAQGEVRAAEIPSDALRADVFIQPANPERDPRLVYKDEPNPLEEWGGGGPAGKLPTERIAEIENNGRAMCALMASSLPESEIKTHAIALYLNERLGRAP